MDKIKVEFGYGGYHQKVFSCSYKRITFKQLKNSRLLKGKILDLMRQIESENISGEAGRLHATITFDCEIQQVRFPESTEKLSKEFLVDKFLQRIEEAYYHMDGAI